VPRRHRSCHPRFPPPNGRTSNQRHLDHFGMVLKCTHSPPCVLRRRDDFHGVFLAVAGMAKARSAASANPCFAQTVSSIADQTIILPRGFSVGMRIKLVRASGSSRLADNGCKSVLVMTPSLNVVSYMQAELLSSCRIELFLQNEAATGVYASVSFIP